MRGRMYFRRNTSAGPAYLQIVESRRAGDQVRQQVIATLGRFGELQASGQLERLLRSGARFTGRQALRRPLRAASRRQPGIACSRRRAAADRPRGRSLLTPPDPKM
jgi:hypothetical protein